MAAEGQGQTRIASLDQFRGYTVVGMFFVNYVGHFALIPAIFKHHNTYCSYADTIMPQFFFAVGFAYRLTLLRRLEIDGPLLAYSRAIRRNLGLILLGIVIYHLNGRASGWDELTELGWRGFFTNAFRRDPFETLVHIGVTALWIMPVIAARPLIRMAFMIFSAALHCFLSDRFYFRESMATFPVIDGGPLGFLTWSIPMLAGSLAYDILLAPRPASSWRGRIAAAAAKTLAWGSILMLVGYGMSCLSTLYNEPGLTAEDAGVPELAASPVRPPFNELANRDIWSLAAEPPFVQPTRERYSNYWMMSQRGGTLSYLIFSSGFSLALYALFILACDLRSDSDRPPRRLLSLSTAVEALAWLILVAGALGFLGSLAGLVAISRGGNPVTGLQSLGIDQFSAYLSELDQSGWTWTAVISGLAALFGWDLRRALHGCGTITGSIFQTFGSNALAAYIIHQMVEGAMRPYTPRNGPLWFALATFGLFLAICYLFVRHLEKNKLFLRM